MRGKCSEVRGLREIGQFHKNDEFPKYEDRSSSFIPFSCIERSNFLSHFVKNA